MIIRVGIIIKVTVFNLKIAPKKMWSYIFENRWSLLRVELVLKIFYLKGLSSHKFWLALSRFERGLSQIAREYTTYQQRGCLKFGGV